MRPRPAAIDPRATLLFSGLAALWGAGLFVWLGVLHRWLVVNGGNHSALYAYAPWDTVLALLSPLLVTLMALPLLAPFAVTRSPLTALLGLLALPSFLQAAQIAMALAD
ncbi:MAG: hypothetical protein QM765_26710 [Myxococcales bacterium]